MKIKVQNTILVSPIVENIRYNESEDFPIVFIDLKSNGNIVTDVLLGQMDKSKYNDINVFINDVLENFKVVE